MKKLKHSKYKNTGFIYEMIVRQITADIISGKDSIAERILSKYFGKGTELAKELHLYQTIMSKKGMSEGKADRLINTVLEARNRLSDHRLYREKFEIIREIKENYNIEAFFSTQVPTYRVLASIYKLFENATSSDLYRPKDVYMSRNTIVESITTKPSKKINKDPLVEAFTGQDENMRNLTQFIFLKRFNEKYRVLNSKQKNLLREYINNISNTNSLSGYVRKEVPRIQKRLLEISNKVKDEVTIIKINETIRQLDTAKHGKIIKDNQITALMLSYELIKELENVTNH